MKKEEMLLNVNNKFVKKLNKVTDFLNKVENEDELKFNYILLGCNNNKSKKYQYGDLEYKKEYLLKAITKKIKEELNLEIKEVESVYNAFDVQKAVISVEWKKSKMWGSNPTALAKIYGDNNYVKYQTRSIGGCGYDKLSTAIAEALNMSNEMKKVFYENCEKVSSYGFSNNNDSITLDGGVGVSCYYNIFNELGYEFNCVASGDNYDVYEVKKIVKE